MGRKRTNKQSTKVLENPKLIGCFLKSTNSENLFTVGFLQMKYKCMNISIRCLFKKKNNPAAHVQNFYNMN